ncbi:hypothetical protein [Calothrix sp. NIES-2098]
MKNTPVETQSFVLLMVLDVLQTFFELVLAKTHAEDVNPSTNFAVRK